MKMMIIMDDPLVSEESLVDRCVLSTGGHLVTGHHGHRDGGR